MLHARVRNSGLGGAFYSNVAWANKNLGRFVLPYSNITRRPGELTSDVTLPLWYMLRLRAGLKLGLRFRLGLVTLT